MHLGQASRNTEVPPILKINTGFNACLKTQHTRLSATLNKDPDLKEYIAKHTN